MRSIIAAAALLAGCTSADSASGTQQQSDQAQGAKASYLCVGMETSWRFGDCPGCALDALRLSSLMRTRMGYSGETLVSDKATKAAVVERLRKGVEATPEDGLFLFFYSGHGGQERLGGQEPDGADSPDEFLCLYDTYMLDDEIWDIVSRCRGRVFLYFDACHSATMYRTAKVSVRPEGANARAVALSVPEDELVRTKGFTFRPEKFVRARAMDAGAKAASPRILCWSGCQEEEYSYGASTGGMLTVAVINGWRSGLSYTDLWASASKAVNQAQPTQHPVQTVIGGFQKTAEAFR